MSKIPPTKIQNWKILKSTEIPLHRYMSIRKDDVQTPEGKILDYYILDIPLAVAVLPFTKEGKIVLVRQYKHGYGGVIIELCSGIVEEGEDLKKAAIRELEEETGIKYEEKKLELLGVGIQSPSKVTLKHYIYLAREVMFNSNQSFDENENIEVIQLEPKEAIEMIKRGEICGSDTVAFILKTQLLYPELFN